LPNTNLYNLKQVDYSERGRTVEIFVDGVPKSQTIIFSGTDCFGENYYFTEQGLRYIRDSRLRRLWQHFVLDYFNKIPIILRSPQIVARETDYDDRYLFCKRFTIKERSNRKCLLCVVLIKTNVNIVWNFYWLQENRLPGATAIIYKRRD
jgi:hypothetical protein